MNSNLISNYFNDQQKSYKESENFIYYLRYLKFFNLNSMYLPWWFSGLAVNKKGKSKIMKKKRPNSNFLSQLKLKKGLGFKIWNRIPFYKKRKAIRRIFKKTFRLFAFPKRRTRIKPEEVRDTWFKTQEPFVKEQRGITPFKENSTNFIQQTSLKSQSISIPHKLDLPSNPKDLAESDIWFNSNLSVKAENLDVDLYYDQVNLHSTRTKK